MRLVLIAIATCVAVAGACASQTEREPSLPAGGAGATGGSGTGGATGGSVGTGGSGAGGAGGSATGGATGGSVGTGGSGAGGAVATGGDGGSAGTGGSAPADGGSTPEVDAGGPIVGEPGAPCPKCVKIFNGMTFDGWEAAPATWKITMDGAMHGQGGVSRTAYTKADYGNVRLIFTTRMNPVNGDHLGVLFWGDRPMDPSMPQINNAGWMQYMPNYAGMWTYHPPKDRGLPAMKVGNNPTDWTTWHTVELLLTLDTGTVRAATDGVEVMKYVWTNPTERTDPMTRIIPGPIGMMKHGGGGSEYKDIWVEVNPTEDKLYTVK